MNKSTRGLFLTFFLLTNVVSAQVPKKVRISERDSTISVVDVNWLTDGGFGGPDTNPRFNDVLGIKPLKRNYSFILERSAFVHFSIEGFNGVHVHSGHNYYNENVLFARIKGMISLTQDTFYKSLYLNDDTSVYSSMYTTVVDADLVIQYAQIQEFGMVRNKINSLRFVKSQIIRIVTARQCQYDALY